MNREQTGAATGRVLVGDALAVLQTLPTASARCCVTSPPYWGLRDYGVAGQLGLESTPDEYVAKLVAVFSEVRRVLCDDGTLWLNLGDSYANDGKWGGSSGGKHVGALHGQHTAGGLGRGKRKTGLKPKDLVGIPWRVAFALQADGWFLRQEIIWHKPNPMPESVRDRPTRTHEQIFLLSKAPNYFYDADAIAEAVSPNTHLRVSQDVAAQVGSARANGGARPERPMKAAVRCAGVNPKADRDPDGSVKQNRSFAQAVCLPVTQRNSRSVWTMATGAFREAHFATFPVELAQRCIRAGSVVADTVLDPFAGAGTTLLAAVGLARSALGIELNPEYAAMARKRFEMPLFSEAAS
jgi:DNA modification methylase